MYLCIYYYCTFAPAYLYSICTYTRIYHVESPAGPDAGVPKAGPQACIGTCLLRTHLSLWGLANSIFKFVCVIYNTKVCSPPWSGSRQRKSGQRDSANYRKSTGLEALCTDWVSRFPVVGLKDSTNRIQRFKGRFCVLRGATDEGLRGSLKPKQSTPSTHTDSGRSHEHRPHYPW